MDLKEKELIADLKTDGKKDMAFHILVKTYQEKLYWHIRRIVVSHDDADDILQNVFIKVWKNVESFREDSSLYTWLYRIATNESLSFLHKSRRQSFFSLDDQTSQIMEEPLTDKYFDGDELQTKLQAAVLRLPDKQKIVFNMKYFEEMKYEEMAEILKTSVGALKASYHHAVKKIEEFLGNE
jgi:RNA polymerase sigma-70 factor (ECF subfamily)